MKVLNNILFLERLNLLSLLIIVPVYKTLNYKVYFYHYKGKYDFLIRTSSIGSACLAKKVCFIKQDSEFLLISEKLRITTISRMK